MLASDTRRILNRVVSNPACQRVLTSSSSWSLTNLRHSGTTAETVKSIGFIGLGRMGYPMALNILKNYQDADNEPNNSNIYRRKTEIYLYDVDPDRASELIKEHSLMTNGSATVVAVAAKSVSHLSSNCSTIITMLPNTSHVFDTMTRSDGVFCCAKKGTLLLDCSTIDPITSKALHDIAGENFSLSFLDCPVSGGVAGATAGTLTFMVGATGERFERIKPILGLMGKKFFSCGDAGSGGVAKLCNNLSLAISMIGTAEAMNLGVKLGMDSVKLAEVMNASTARCWSSEINNPCPGVLPNAPSSRNYEGGFGSVLMKKDLRLAVDAAASRNISLPTGQHAYDTYTSLCEQGLSHKDFSVVYDHLSKS